MAANSYEVLYSASNGVIATGVAKIQFNFGTQQNAYVGYGELDVIGVPTAFRSKYVDYNGIDVTVAAGSTLDTNGNTVVLRALSGAGTVTNQLTGSPSAHGRQRHVQRRVARRPWHDRTPLLLQLSGVGDPEHLARIGVPVRHALRGVGRNFQDHFLVRVQAEVKDIATLNERSRGLRFAGEVFKYVATGRGMLTYAASLLAASVKVLEESATPDVQALFASASYAPGTSRVLDSKPGMTSGLWQMRPESRGSVLARTGDPRDQPAINPNYLAEDRDRRTIIAGMRKVRDWFRAPALQRYLVAETLPGPDVQTDDEFLAYARQTGTTVFHATCSCRMGQDPMAVVDDQLRVHGLQGLRVIDASVMPAVTSTNTNAPTIMIAEKGAVLVKAAARVAQAA